MRENKKDDEWAKHKKRGKGITYKWSQWIIIWVQNPVLSF